MLGMQNATVLLLWEVLQAATCGVVSSGTLATAWSFGHVATWLLALEQNPRLNIKYAPHHNEGNAIREMFDCII